MRIFMWLDSIEIGCEIDESHNRDGDLHCEDEEKKAIESHRSEFPFFLKEDEEF